MNLESKLKGVKDEGRSLTIDERAQLCCRLAKEFQEAGEYEAAREALSEFWQAGSGWSNLQGLNQKAKAEVLLRVGGLKGWQGSTEHEESPQERAKDFLTQSIELFEAMREPNRAAEARSELALCYWREGSFNEARDILIGVINDLRESNSDVLAKALLRRAIVEKTAGRYIEALEIYREASAIIDREGAHGPKGELHNGLGTLLNCLGHAEGREEYIDRSLVEFAAASFHFERAGHKRYQACVDINLGFLYLTIGNYSEAHEYLDRARSVLIEIGDNVHLAQVNDTRARTLLAEGKLPEAEKYAQSAVRTLEKGDEQALLAEALTTYGTVQARLGRHPQARSFLQRAITVAETAGDLEGAGRAKLSIIEELLDQTSPEDLALVYQSAAELLERSQDPSASKRLISCARKVIEALASAEDEEKKAKEQSWEGFSFKQQILDCEKALIERALRDAGGSVTRAARLLGFHHHQSLISLINSRHKDLLKTRTAVRRRRRHIFSEPRKIKTRPGRNRAYRGAAQVSVLHVGNPKLASRLVGEMLAPDEWRVEVCTDGDSALRKLTSSDDYDLLVIDEDLSGLTALELAQRTRKITHRRRTPVIMLAGGESETQAWRAGVDAFLKKPDEVDELPTTVARLLKIDLKRD